MFANQVCDVRVCRAESVRVPQPDGHQCGPRAGCVVVETGAHLIWWPESPLFHAHDASHLFVHLIIMVNISARQSCARPPIARISPRFASLSGAFNLSLSSPREMHAATERVEKPTTTLEWKWSCAPYNKSASGWRSFKLTSLLQWMGFSHASDLCVN